MLIADSVAPVLALHRDGRLCRSMLKDVENGLVLVDQLPFEVELDFYVVAAGCCQQLSQYVGFFLLCFLFLRGQYFFFFF